MADRIGSLSRRIPCFFCCNISDTIFDRIIAFPDHSGVLKMNSDLVDSIQLQGMSVDKFFYFFMGLRKGEVKRRVATMHARYPDETAEQLARRLSRNQIPLSFIGGALMNSGLAIPGSGPLLKLLGIGTGASVLMRMHLSLVLEIAMLFGKDIDDQARIKELYAVMAAAGLVSGGSVAAPYLNLKPYYTVLVGGVTVAALSQLISETAIQYYKREAVEEEVSGVVLDANVAN